MADEQTKTREQELIEEFKAGLDPAGAAALQLRIDELTAENKKLDDELGLDEQEKIDLEGQADKLQKDLDAANARADALQANLDAANGKLGDMDALRAELDAAVAKAATAEKAATVAKAAVTRGEKSTKPRKLGPVDNGLTGDALSDAIAAADADGKKVEIVLSDGKREIAGVAPIAVTGDVWREHTLGKMLKDPVVVHGPAIGETGFTIDGYALLIDGKQVAYCKRSDVINIAPGGQASIADDIYF